MPNKNKILHICCSTIAILLLLGLIYEIATWYRTPYDLGMWLFTIHVLSRMCNIISCSSSKLIFCNFLSFLLSFLRIYCLKCFLSGGFLLLVFLICCFSLVVLYLSLFGYSLVFFKTFFSSLAVPFIFISWWFCRFLSLVPLFLEDLRRSGDSFSFFSDSLFGTIF